MFNPFNIAGVNVTVLEGEEHTRVAQMTEQVCETGRIISDHIILKPKSVTLRVEQSNASPGSTNARDATTQVYNFLDTVWSNRTPVTLVTTHGTYDNMVITNLSGLHRAPLKWTLKFVVTFTQMNLVITPNSAIPVSEIANPSQASEQKAGTVGSPTLPAYDGTTFQQWVKDNASATQTFSSNENVVYGARSP